MKMISDEQVRQVLTMSESAAAVREAFVAAAQQRAISLQRTRINLDHLTLSAMGGIVPNAGACGAKVYSTNAGQFDFVVVLFDADDGHFLGTVQGNALTEFRTAATTRVVVEHQMPLDARTLTVFGTGIQAKAHIATLLELGVFRRVFIVSRGSDSTLMTALRAAHRDVEFLAGSADEAVPQADVIVTCTRSTTPLFDGNLLKPNALVAAIGSSKPQSREIDDTTLQRAARIIVEHKEQARKEAGDLLLAAPSIVDWNHVEELGVMLAGAAGHPPGITVYKSVGVGLVDVALSALVYRKVVGASQ
ncbi:ornithine cyclodeaminase family protein [Cupriavidus pauculus]|uniref:Ornithine cyclodeaminase n=1 Tax=Cupriavidus pauculus TaxID=82633 RepID=A0A2N5CDN6_9BURK|nr:ornithine cyclodeaminase family protein [Cupriavidus pauculus]PLQ00308.1 ornithine cyclodeaminase [Cupriavidus pauculus]